MTQTQKQKAVIYCRVASMSSSDAIEDVTKDQEIVAADYAKARGYDVVDVYRDHASGSTADRPAFNAMLVRLDERRGEGFVVITADRARIARGGSVKSQIQNSLQALGATLEIVSTTYTGLEVSP